MNEKIYKTMSRCGAGSIALGIIVLVTGVTSGVLMLISGARLLKRKTEITFQSEKIEAGGGESLPSLCMSLMKCGQKIEYRDEKENQNIRKDIICTVHSFVDLFFVFCGALWTGEL